MSNNYFSAVAEGGGGNDDTKELSRQAKTTRITLEFIARARVKSWNQSRFAQVAAVNPAVRKRKMFVTDQIPYNTSRAVCFAVIF